MDEFLPNFREVTSRITNTFEKGRIGIDEIDDLYRFLNYMNVNIYCNHEKYDASREFINLSLRSIVLNILSSELIDVDGIIRKTLQVILQISAYEFFYDNVQVYDIVIMILGRDQQIYKKNSRKTNQRKNGTTEYYLYDGVLKSFINEEIFSFLAHRLSCPSAMLGHYSTFSEIFQVISQHISIDVKTNIMLVYTSSFVENISTYVKQNEKILRSEKIVSIIEFVVQHTDSQEVVSKIYSSIKELTEYQRLESRLLGLECIEKIIFSPLMRGIISPFELSLYFIQKDPHVEIIKKLIPIETQISEFKSPSLNQLVLIWNSLKNLHFSQRDLFSLMIAEILYKCNNRDIEEFILQKIPMQGIEDARIVFISASKMGTNPNIQKQLLEKFFTFIQEKPLIVTDVVKMINSHHSSDTFLKQFVELLFSNLLKTSNPSFSSILSVIIPKIKDNKHSYYDKFDILEQFSRKKSDLSLVIPIYESIVLREKKILPIPFMNALLGSSNTEIISSLFKTIVDTIGLSGFPENSLSMIQDFYFCRIKNLKNKDLEFLKLYLYFINVKKECINAANKNSRLISHKFTTKKLPIEGQTLLFQILLYNDALVNTIIPFIVEIFSQITKTIYKQMVDIFVDQIGSCTKDANISAIIFVFNSIISKIEPTTLDLSILGCSRHQNIFPFKESLIEFNWIYNETSVSFFIDKNKTIKDFAKQFSEIVGISNSSFKIKVNNSEKPDSTTFADLSQEGFTDLIIILTNRNSVLRIPDYPSYVLHSMEWTKTLIRFLENKNQPYIKNVYAMLKFLPTDKTIKSKASNSKTFITMLERFTGFHPILIRYSMQVFLVYSRNLINGFCANKGLSFIIDYLRSIDGKNSCTEIEDLFSLVSFDYFQSDIKGLIQVFFEILKGNEISPNSKESAAKILLYFANCSSDIVFSIVESDHFSTFKDIINQPQQSFWIIFTKFLSLCNNPVKIFLFIENSLRNKEIREHQANYIELYLQFLKYNRKINEKGFISIVFSNTGCFSNFRIGALLMDNMSIVQNFSEESIREFISLTIESVSAASSVAVKSVFLKCLSKLGSKCLENEAIEKYIDQIFSIVINRWNYNPFDEMKMQDSFTGLKNLGSTCYINSVIQQLRNCTFFCDRLNDPSLVDSISSNLRELFTSMLLTQQKYADPSVFISSLKSWDNNPINPREQQDAMEFLYILLNQLPESLKSSFKGVQISRFSGLDQSVEEFREEEFFSIHIPIKGLTCLDESLNELLSEENLVGDNQYMSQNYGKIDATKSVRIKSIPEVLVLQLKRFEYNYENGTRNKLYDRFEFPESINCQSLMFDSSIEANYELTGIVLHSGNSLQGHYTSLVKTESCWIDYNDMRAEIIPQYQDLSFGGKTEEYLPSAYLLFYQRKDREIRKIMIDEGVMSMHTQENIYLANIGFSFSDEFILFLEIFENPLYLIRYFFSILSHSKLDDIVKRIVKIILNLIQKPEWSEKCTNLILNSTEYIKIIYENCSNFIIIEGLSDILYGVFEKTPHLVNSLIEFLISLMEHYYDSWRIISNLLSCLNRLSLLLKCGLNGEAIFRIALITTSKERNSVYRENFPYSLLFSSIVRMNCFSGKLFNELYQNHPNICINNDNAKAFIGFFVHFSSLGYIGYEYPGELMDLYPQYFSEKDKVYSCINSLNNQNQETVSKIMSLIRNKVLMLECLLKHLSEHPNEIRSTILNHPDLLVFSFCELIETMVLAEKIVNELFCFIPPLTDHQKHKIVLNDVEFAKKQSYSSEIEKEIIDFLQNMLSYVDLHNICNTQVYCRIIRFLGKEICLPDKLSLELSHWCIKTQFKNENNGVDSLLSVITLHHQEIMRKTNILVCYFPNEISNMKRIRFITIAILQNIHILDSDTKKLFMFHDFWSSICDCFAQMESKEDIEISKHLACLFGDYNPNLFDKLMFSEERIYHIVSTIDELEKFCSKRLDNKQVVVLFNTITYLFKNFKNENFHMMQRLIYFTINQIKGRQIDCNDELASMNETILKSKSLNDDVIVDLYKCLCDQENFLEKIVYPRHASEKGISEFYVFKARIIISTKGFPINILVNNHKSALEQQRKPKVEKTTEKLYRLYNSNFNDEWTPRLAFYIFLDADLQTSTEMEFFERSIHLWNSKDIHDCCLNIMRMDKPSPKKLILLVKYDRSVSSIINSNKERLLNLKQQDLGELAILIK